MFLIMLGRVRGLISIMKMMQYCGIEVKHCVYKEIITELYYREHYDEYDELASRDQ